MHKRGIFLKIKIGLIFIGIFTFKICLTKFNYFSQHKQDKFVYENFFKKKKNGVFVDIGAHDGISYSNTLFFEQYLNWTGICIEPMPSVFSKLVKNRSCICVNGCIANFNGKEEFLLISGYSDMLSGLMSHYHQKHIDRIDREILLYGGSKKLIEVDCYKLETILKKYGISKIDFLSIDTEGNEFSILQSIDFNCIDIDVITVENNYRDKKIRDLLEKNGYDFIRRIRCDEIYKKR